MYTIVIQYFCRLYSIIGYYKIMGIIPCAIKHILVAYLFFLRTLFIYFWLCWVLVAGWAFFSCGEWGPLFVVVLKFLIAVVSLVAEHGL